MKLYDILAKEAFLSEENQDKKKKMQSLFGAGDKKNEKDVLKSLIRGVKSEEHEDKENEEGEIDEESEESPKENLSIAPDRQEAALKEIFSAIDTNKDKQISEDEFRNAVEKVEHRNAEPYHYFETGMRPIEADYATRLMDRPDLIPNIYEEYNPLVVGHGVRNEHYAV